MVSAIRHFVHGILRRVSRRLVKVLSILLVIVSAAVLLSVSFAAAGDLHPGGFDNNCNLCLFNRAPLIHASPPVFVPPSELVSWEVRVVPVLFRRQQVVLSGLCRAPPAPLS